MRRNALQPKRSTSLLLKGRQGGRCCYWFGNSGEASTFNATHNDVTASGPFPKQTSPGPSAVYRVSLETFPDDDGFGLPDEWTAYA